MGVVSARLPIHKVLRILNLHYQFPKLNQNILNKPILRKFIKFLPKNSFAHNLWLTIYRDIITLLIHISHSYAFFDVPCIFGIFGALIFVLVQKKVRVRGVFHTVGMLTNCWSKNTFYSSRDRTVI